MKWCLSQAFSDYDLDVFLDHPSSMRSLVARVEAEFMARELTDEKTLKEERDSIQVYVGPLDHLKHIANRWLEKADRWLDKLDRYGRSRSLIPMEYRIGFRFKVKTRPVEILRKSVEKRVYHLCPHLAKEMKDHYTWTVATPCRDGREDFRHVHRLWAIVNEALKRDPYQAYGVLQEIKYYLERTGAFRSA